MPHDQILKQGTLKQTVTTWQAVSPNVTDNRAGADNCVQPTRGHDLIHALACVSQLLCDCSILQSLLPAHSPLCHSQGQIARQVACQVLHLHAHKLILRLHLCCYGRPAEAPFLLAFFDLPSMYAWRLILGTTLSYLCCARKYAAIP